LKEWSNRDKFRNEFLQEINKEKVISLETLILFHHWDKTTEKERIQKIDQFNFKYKTFGKDLEYTSEVISKVWRDIGGFWFEICYRGRNDWFLCYLCFHLMWSQIKLKESKETVQEKLYDLKISLFQSNIFLDNR
jgi:hypothetical protein